MASDLGSLAYCYKLPMNGKGAKVAKDYCFLSAWVLVDNGDTDLGSPRASYRKILKP